MPIGHFTIIQRLDIRHRPFRNHKFLARLRLRFRTQIPPLEIRKVHRIPERAPIERLPPVPVQVPQPPTQPRVVVPDHLQIAHEDVVVGDVEPDQGGVQPDVRFGDVRAEQVRVVPWLPEVCFQAIQRFEERIQVRFIGLLGRCEASLVHAVVNRVVDPLVHLINLPSQPLRIKPAPGLLLFAQMLGQQGVEFGIEHADDLAALVVHNRLRLLVPQRGHGEAPFVPRIGLLVQLLHLREAVQRVLLVRAVAAGEEPPFLRELEAAGDELDDGFEALEGADEVRAVRPGTTVV